MKRYGNWFIQLQPNSYIHLNFWGHPTDPMPPIRTNIHTHDTSFKSLICYGEMRNKCYSSIETEPIENALQIYVIKRNSNGSVQFEPTLKYANVEITEDVSYFPGMDYTMEYDTFHMTQITKPTITWLTQRKDGPFQQFVLIPMNSGPNLATKLAPVETVESRNEALDRIDKLCILAGI